MRLAKLNAMDDPATLAEQEALGRLAAKKQIDELDFPNAFDLA